MVKYRDLVQFEPIESVIQLKDANDLERAFHLLDTQLSQLKIGKYTLI